MCCDTVCTPRMLWSPAANHPRRKILVCPYCFSLEVKKSIQCQPWVSNDIVLKTEPRTQLQQFKCTQQAIPHECWKWNRGPDKMIFMESASQCKRGIVQFLSIHWTEERKRKSVFNNSFKWLKNKIFKFYLYGNPQM